MSKQDNTGCGCALIVLALLGWVGFSATLDILQRHEKRMKVIEQKLSISVKNEDKWPSEEVEGKQDNWIFTR